MTVSLVTPGPAAHRSLQDLLDEVGDGLVGYFYHETAAPHFSRSASAGAYLPPEFTNWRDEQRAWREAAVLFDQSHHMPELFLAGPDALRLLERVGVNSFAGFGPGRAGQLVACTPRGHVIGDCVLYHLQDGTFELVSGATLLDWVHYQAETGGFDVTVRRDNATLDNPAGRRARFRFQLDGPAAGDILAAAAHASRTWRGTRRRQSGSRSSPCPTPRRYGGGNGSRWPRPSPGRRPEPDPRRLTRFQRHPPAPIAHEPRPRLL